jgi:arginyl-tRNA synthetase
MNLFTHFRGAVAAKISALAAAGELPEGLDLDGLTVEPPRDPAHGDIATNAALVLAKQAGKPPRAIADALAVALRDDPDVEAVDVAGPGFINMRLRTGFWHARLKDVLRAGTSYGTSRLGEGVRVNVEYVSANPTGPLHVGHCRGAVFGDALAALLEKAGYDVTREYYINDAGAQVEVLARSAHVRYREALGEDVGEIPEGLYPGDYLKPVGEGLAARFGDGLRDKPEADWLETVKRFTIDRMMAMIRDDLAALGIVQEIFFSEATLGPEGRIDHALDVLTAKGLIYEGVLEPPKGKAPDDWEPRPQTLFRATEFGDDTDRPLKKSDGSWTYFAGDIAYHLDKFERGFRRQIDVWGADHSGYIKRMKAAVEAVSGGEASLEVRICQLVKLFRNGEPVRMSKRAGSFVTLRDVVDEVGKDVVRFMMLTRKNDAPLDFDFAKVTEQSKDNPVFYVQYAHARCRSVLRHAAEQGFATGRDALASAPIDRLVHADEVGLVRRLAQWPRLVEAAALANEPHRIAFMLYDLASDFHALWNKGKDDPGLRFVLSDQPDLTAARLALLQATCDVIASGLGVLGVEPAEEMR